jgi:hypothetical protein
VPAATVGPVINEIQSSNQATVTDEEGDAEDWLELYNASSTAINLAGWSLTDDATDLRKWTFTEGVLQPGKYLLIFASGKDRRVAVPYFHTNFKLSASGDYLALIDPSGNRVSEVNPVPTMGADTSYGLVNGAWAFLQVPTPGAWNATIGLLRYPAPVFSHERGFYEAPFSLKLSTVVGYSRVYYTLDGSEPDALRGTLYTEPIPIQTTSVVRAITVAIPGSPITFPNSPVATHTFLFADSILRQTNRPNGYPLKWGLYQSIPDTAIADYEMDPELMADPLYAEKAKNSFQDLPVISIVTKKGYFFDRVYNADTGGIYMFTEEHNPEWERPISLEYIYPKASVAFQANATAQLHGGASRLPEKTPKHSLGIDFKERLGLNKLAYPLFGKDGPKVINSFYLRAGFSDSWNHWSTSEQQNATYSRDQWAKLTQLRMGNSGSHGVYAHLFINGIYWGLYNPIERIDNDFCAYWFGGNKDDWDVIKDGGATDGTRTAWSSLWTEVSKITPSTAIDTLKNQDSVQSLYGRNLMQYYRLQGLTPDGSPDPSGSALIDIDNFIDYMLINYYGVNTDWDSHNWITVRNRLKPGKGFRFLCWDTENILHSSSGSQLTVNNAGAGTGFLQKLKSVPLFKVRFADRVQQHCFNDGWLTASKAAQTFVDLTTSFESGLYAESARWGDYRRDVHPYTSVGKLYRKDGQFDAQKSTLLSTYFPVRTDKFIQQLQAAGLFPPVLAPVYKVNGKAVASDTLFSGDQLTLSNAANASMYYTLDGSDPVLWSVTGVGTPSAVAVRYTNALSPSAALWVKARAWNGTSWSALNDRRFAYAVPTDIDDQTRLTRQISGGCFPSRVLQNATFRLELPASGTVCLQVFDVSGRLLLTPVQGVFESGVHEVPFDASRLASGMYYCRMQVSGSLTRTLTFRFVKE